MSDYKIRGWPPTAEFVVNSVTRIETLEARIEALEAALRAVVADIDEYERVNSLAPSPGKSECWQSVANARAALAPEQDK